MRYSYFEKEIEKLGFRVVYNDTHVTVRDRQNTLAKVSKKQRLIFNTDFPYFYELKEVERRIIANLTYDLANTVLKNRIEDKYYYKLKGFAGDVYKQLNCTESGKYFLAGNSETPLIKTQFTDAEFAKLPEDIKSHNWEKIKVEREEQ